MGAQPPVTPDTSGNPAATSVSHVNSCSRPQILKSLDCRDANSSVLKFPVGPNQAERQDANSTNKQHSAGGFRQPTAQGEKPLWGKNWIFKPKTINKFLKTKKIVISTMQIPAKKFLHPPLPISGPGTYTVRSKWLGSTFRTPLTSLLAGISAAGLHAVRERRDLAWSCTKGAWSTHESRRSKDTAAALKTSRTSSAPSRGRSSLLTLRTPSASLPTWYLCRFRDSTQQLPYGPTQPLTTVHWIPVCR